MVLLCRGQLTCTTGGRSSDRLRDDFWVGSGPGGLADVAATAPEPSLIAPQESAAGDAPGPRPAPSERKIDKTGFDEKRGSSTLMRSVTRGGVP